MPRKHLTVPLAKFEVASSEPWILLFKLEQKCSPKTQGFHGMINRKTNLHQIWTMFVPEKMHSTGADQSCLWSFCKLVAAAGINGSCMVENDTPKWIARNSGARIHIATSTRSSLLVQVLLHLVTPHHTRWKSRSFHHLEVSKQQGPNHPRTVIHLFGSLLHLQSLPPSNPGPPFQNFLSKHPSTA